MIKSEHLEQVAFFHAAKKYLRLIGQDSLIFLLFAIPNGGKRDVATACRLKMEGVRPGVPDIFFAHPAGIYHGLFIEMKKAKGGATSTEQKEMIFALEQQGYACHVAKGADIAYSIFMRYMEDGLGI